MPSPVMLVFAVGKEDVVFVEMDNETSVLLHDDAQDEREDKFIAPPWPVLNAIELLEGRVMVHVTNNAWLADDGQVTARINLIHNAHAERKLHVDRKSVVLHAVTFRALPS